MNHEPYEYENGRQNGQFAMPSIGEYISRTFLWMVLGLMVTFGVALVTWMTGLVQVTVRFHLVLLIVTLVLSASLVARIEGMSVGAAQATFVLFSAVFGITMASVLWSFGLTTVLLTFLATALYFAALAIYGRVTNADLSGYQPILVSGLIFLIAFGLMSFFIPGFQMFDRLVCLIGIATFLGYTAYDTQRMCEFYDYYRGYPDMLEKASVFSALQLYLDFINLFLYLLRFFGRRKNN